LGSVSSVSSSVFSGGHHTDYSDEISTAIVWKNFQQAYVLRGHEEAVWSVLPVKEDVILTGTMEKIGNGKRK
jgi:hypothetical protein